ncbi:ribonuclease P [Candidatus Woesearchaeota archaeon CG_4_10_14_0_2_um_filter_33_13]|nr:MAG: ribonuclease P [Candidatus Woesearchaeota archaeon CG_4_10_14_0_2_um_filter_33_13]
MSKPVISKTAQKEIALNRVKSLLKQAEDVFSKDKSLSNRYVTLARKIAMKVKLHLPLELKRKFCKHCYKFMMPGINARIRTRDGKVIISCLECKHFTRISIKKKVKNES